MVPSRSAPAARRRKRGGRRGRRSRRGREPSPPGGCASAAAAARPSVLSAAALLGYNRVLGLSPWQDPLGAHGGGPSHDDTEEAQALPLRRLTAGDGGIFLGPPVVDG